MELESTFTTWEKLKSFRAQDTLRHALALGADNAIHIVTEDRIDQVI
jgi:hypothetical protein